MIFNKLLTEKNELVARPGGVKFELGQRGQVLGGMPGVEKLLTPLVTAVPVSVSHLKPDDLTPKADIL